jgi:hypothetical protein
MKAMFRLRPACYAALFSIAAIAAGDLPPAARTKMVYTRGIQPLFASRSYICRGARQQMIGLRLDRKDAAFRVIEPGESSSSRTIQMVAGLGKVGRDFRLTDVAGNAVRKMLA